jgi:hypothetical protein
MVGSVWRLAPAKRTGTPEGGKPFLEVLTA